MLMNIFLFIVVGERFDLLFILVKSLIAFPHLLSQAHYNPTVFLDVPIQYNKIQHQDMGCIGGPFIDKCISILSQTILIFEFFLLIYNNQNQMNSKLGAKVGLLDQFHVEIDLPFTIRQADYRKSCIYQRDGHWNQKQRLKYSIFIQFFKAVFEDPFKKKAVRIYEMMSDMIVTRNPAQCRSHHQKMQKYRQTIDEIVKSVAQKYQPRIYKEIQHKYLVLIKVILQNKEKYTRNPNPRKRYIHPKPIIHHKNTQKLPILKPIDQIPIQVLKEVEIKPKQELRKTADSYGELENVESQNIDQIPVISLYSSKIEEDSSVIIQKAVHSENVFFTFLPAYSSLNCNLMQRVKVSLQGRQNYYQQKKMLQMKRQWHINMVQQLNTQLMSEKQAIKNCDISIGFYEAALKKGL